MTSSADAAFVCVAQVRAALAGDVEQDVAVAYEHVWGDRCGPARRPQFAKVLHEIGGPQQT